MCPPGRHSILVPDSPFATDLILVPPIVLGFPDLNHGQVCPGKQDVCQNVGAVLATENPVNFVIGNVIWTSPFACITTGTLRAGQVHGNETVLIGYKPVLHKDARRVFGPQSRFFVDFIPAILLPLVADTDGPFAGSGPPARIQRAKAIFVLFSFPGIFAINRPATLEDVLLLKNSVLIVLGNEYDAMGIAQIVRIIRCIQLNHEDRA